MFFGAALILAALSLFLWNRYEDARAGKAADKILPRVMEEIQKTQEEEKEGMSGPDSYMAGMTEAELEGYTWIGCLSIPSLDLELPVMSEWSYRKLKISPCRYAGSIKTDNLVIAAHNYSRHFGTIGNLTPGDLVYFIDMDGMVSTYEVVETDILSPVDTEEMTDSGFGLTLFTCTYGGQSRVTVRCDRVKK